MTAPFHAIVVGGGLAGPAFAIALARAGRSVALIEREAGPHDKVCGEFLSHEALGYLGALDVRASALGAVPIRNVALSHGRRSAARALPFRAASLSRRVLDEALLDQAARVGVTVIRGSAVRALSRAGAGWIAELKDGRTVLGNEAALACGKHDLRGHARPDGMQNDLIGLKAHFQLSGIAAARLHDTVLMGLFPGGYAGLEPIEGGRFNLCLVVRERRYAALGRDWARLLYEIGVAAPAIGEALTGGEAIHCRPLAIARIPYGHVAARGPEDGCWRLGDQAAVIPSFSGDGMSIALHSARIAAETMLTGGTSADHHARLRADVARRVALATMLSRGLVHLPIQTAAAAFARLWPRSLSVLARATRIPEAALH